MTVYRDGSRAGVLVSSDNEDGQLDETFKTNDIHKGWSIGFVMILMTYLLPSPIILRLYFSLSIFLKAFINTSNPFSSLILPIDIIFNYLLTFFCLLKVL